MKEGALVTKIKKALEAEGACCFKIHGGQYSQGVMDLIVVHRGRFFGMEVKLPGREKKVTELQMEQIRKVRAAGGIAGVVTSVTDARLMMHKGVTRHGI
jgi:hypothetical protein